jgi:hypothetical protein
MAIKASQASEQAKTEQHPEHKGSEIASLNDIKREDALKESPSTDRRIRRLRTTTRKLEYRVTELEERIEADRKAERKRWRDIANLLAPGRRAH